MGDNIWLGDRDGVRTPMQWTPDRNAGFSTCDPGRLYLPVNMDSIYGYQVTNVESQTRNSLLAAALDAADDPGPQGQPGLRHGHVHRPRRQQPVRAQLRARRSATTSCCASTTCRASRRRSSSTCGPWEGVQPIELMGGAQFPQIGELPYLLTLAGHGFYWLRIPRKHQQPTASRPTRRGCPVIDSRPARNHSSRPGCPRQRWFAGKGRSARAHPGAAGRARQRPRRSTIWTARRRLRRRRQRDLPGAAGRPRASRSRRLEHVLLGTVETDDGTALGLRRAARQGRHAGLAGRHARRDRRDGSVRFVTLRRVARRHPGRRAAAWC